MTHSHSYFPRVFFQEVERCRTQILEVKGPSCPVVVVLNKRDMIRSGSESSESSPHQPYASSSISGGDYGTEDPVVPSGSRRSSSSGRRPSDTLMEEDSPNGASSVGFLSPEMVESLVTCDWGHGFVAASAKTNHNVVQVTALNRLPITYNTYFWALRALFEQST